MNETGTTNRTVIYELDGSFRTVGPPPVCDCGGDNHPMPFTWLCGACGRELAQ